MPIKFKSSQNELFKKTINSYFHIGFNETLLKIIKVILYKMIRFLELIISSIKVKFSKVHDAMFDIYYGINTQDCMYEDKGAKTQATRVGPLKKVLRSLNLPIDASFVDFGCGKGRALLIACNFGFERIVGIELSDELSRIARKNIDKYLLKKKYAVDVEISNCDAQEYQVSPKDSVFYFFNPFSSIVFESVFNNIKDSIDKYPRKVWLIYHNPTCENIITKNFEFKMVREFVFPGTSRNFRIYTNGTQL